MANNNKADLLKSFSEVVRLTIKENVLLRVLQEDGNLIRYYRDLIDNRLLVTTPVKCPSLPDLWSTLAAHGISDLKIAQLNSHNKEIARVFHVSEGVILNFPVAELLIDCIEGCLDPASDDMHLDPEVYKEPRYFLPQSTIEMDSPQISLPRLLSQKKGEIRQIFTTDRERWFKSALDFDEVLAQEVSSNEIMTESTIKLAHEVSKGNVSSLKYDICSKYYVDGSYKWYHGLNIGRYRRMLRDMRWNRFLSSSPSNFSQYEGVYFSNSHVYALMWAMFKAAGYAHLNTPFHQLRGIVVVIDADFSFQKFSHIHPRFIEEFVNSNWKSPFAITEDTSRSINVEKVESIVVGGFPERHMAEISGPGSKYRIGRGRLRVQASSIVKDYLPDIDNLLQMGVFYDEGERWIDKQNLQINFVRLGL